MSVKLASAAAFVLATLSEVGHAAPMVLNFVQATVTAVETSKQKGADKLTAVLNATEVFLNGVAPSLTAPVENVMRAVAAFVNALVELYNEAGVFLHGKPAKA